MSSPSTPVQSTKTTLTKPQWEAVKEWLSVPYRKLFLTADFHLITIETGISRSRVVHMVYVDHWFRGEYLNEGHEFNKYYYPKRIQYPSKAKIKSMKEGVSKKFIKANPHLFTPITKTILTPYYPSISAIKKRLEATCTTIIINPESNSDYGFCMPQ